MERTVVKRSLATVLLTVAGIAVLSVVAMALYSQPASETSSLPFDSEQWSTAGPAERAPMAVDLDRSGRLLRLTYAKMIDRLGAPDRSDLRFSSSLGGSANLYVQFEKGAARFFGANGISPSVTSRPFDAALWSVSRGSDRLPMAAALAGDIHAPLMGKSRDDIVTTLGSADQEWLVYDLDGGIGYFLVVLTNDCVSTAAIAAD